jgi:pilus assembly protein CpaE
MCIRDRGGDGSTSLAVNLATALANDENQRVLLIDLAMPFGDADISVWNKTAEHDVADFCNEVHRLDDALLNSMVAQVRPNLHFMPSPEHFEKVIGIEPNVVQQLLRFLSSRYSFILLDLGSHVDPLTLHAWEMLDQAVLVSAASVPSLRRLKRLCHLWESLGLSPGQLNIVINRLSANLDMELSVFERLCPGKILRRLPLENDAMKASVMQGQPLLSLQPRSGYARTVAAWAAELCGQSPKEKSLWQRLRKK